MRNTLDERKCDACGESTAESQVVKAGGLTLPFAGWVEIKINGARVSDGQTVSLDACCQKCAIKLLSNAL